MLREIKYIMIWIVLVYSLRFISWLVYKMSEMENIGHKKKPCEEKKIFAPKMDLENVVSTYKS